MKSFVLPIACALVPCAAALAQFTPTATPPAKPDDAPQAPFPSGPGETPSEFPGPRGTTIKFPTGLYDENANANEQVRAARERAKKEGKRVLIMWGENRCGFCVFLNDLLLHDAFIAPTVQTEYVWIKINIGKFDRNLDLAQYYNTPISTKEFGAPALTIVDPVTDKAVDVKGGNAMVAKPMTQERVFDETLIRQFVTINRPPMKVAQTLLNDAVAKAKGQKKLVLAYFVLPMCDTCEAMERWITGPDAGPVLSKGFVPVKIDTERTIAGRTILNRMSEGKIVAPPYIAIVNTEGDLAAPGATFSGLPTTTEEIARFTQTIKSAAPAIDQAGLAVLEKSVKAAGEAKPPEPARK